ncbi:MAG TPA: type II toxin-antitoxin system PemK/MazF family toxin [Hanamia sp.]|nr:type II toxin-antitoxin system PemK/MazF family toxin [Hanamia sp.]
MTQGEIWYADLEPVKGSEQAGRRPVVIISGPTMNTAIQTISVCPLTTVIKNIKGCVIIEKNSINNLKKDSEVLVLQIRTISKQRLTKKLGIITKDQLELIKEGVNLYLNY